MSLAACYLADSSVDDSFGLRVDCRDGLGRWRNLLCHFLLWSPLVDGPDEHLAESYHDEQYKKHRDHTDKKELQGSVDVICNHIVLVFVFKAKPHGKACVAVFLHLILIIDFSDKIWLQRYKKYFYLYNIAGIFAMSGLQLTAFVQVSAFILYIWYALF